MKHNIDMMSNNDTYDILAYRMHADIMEAVKHIESTRFSYQRLTVFSILFGFAGIVFLLTRNTPLFNIGISVFIVAFPVLFIVTFFCIFDLFSYVQLICNLIAGAELEEKQKQLPKIFSKMLLMKRSHRKIIFYIALGFCPIITMGFSSYLIVNKHNLLWLCLIIFPTVVALCLYAFSLRKVVVYFEKCITNKKVVK